MDKELLYRFFEGQTSEEEKEKIKVWAESSAENNAILLRERKFFNAMIFCGNEKQQQAAEPKRKNRQYFLNEFVRIACAVVLTAGITIGLTSIGNKDNNVTAMQTITVPSGQRVNVDLPDGTNVWLNAGTKMRYPLSFMKGKREVSIDGEAFFEVAKDDKCPFVVHTFAKDIEVLGTNFNVDAYSSKGIFVTSLLEGKIRLLSPISGEPIVTLSPHQKAMLVNEKIKVGTITDFDVYRWREGLYCFRDKQFGEVVHDLERYYDLRIEMGKPEIGEVLITGKFRITDGLDYALQVLQKSVRFSYHRDKDKDIIYIY